MNGIRSVLDSLTMMPQSSVVPRHVFTTHSFGESVMKLPAWGCCALLLVGALGLDPVRSESDETTEGTFTTVGPAYDTCAVVNLADFAEEVTVVEGVIAGMTGSTRADSLASYGGGAMATGQFRVAAAAYAMFLDEAGIEHPHRERITMWLADCLFPFNYRDINVTHTGTGAQLRPTWRMGFAPTPEYVRHAVGAYEHAASVVGNAHVRGKALLRLGWVHRVLDDWERSTEAWVRGADEASPTIQAADGLWLAIENLVWTDQPAEAVERLRQFADVYADDARMRVVEERLEYLQAEARRSSDWLVDPVKSLELEIEARSDARSPSEVYRSVVKWLGRQHEHAAMIAVCRWACTQDGWPVDARIASRNDLVETLLTKSTASQADHLEAPEAKLADHGEAAKRLGEIVDLAPSDARAVGAAIHRYRLLNELGHGDEADQVIHDIAARVKGSRRWEPVVLTERIESLLERGDMDGAKAVFDTLVESHPDNNAHRRFDGAFAPASEEGTK